MTHPANLNRIRTGTLEIAYEESGPPDGVPVILLHGFPYDPRSFDPVVPLLVVTWRRYSPGPRPDVSCHHAL